MSEHLRPDISRQSPWRLLGRAFLLRCPNCGGGKLFYGFFKVRERCPTCGILLERGEADYFIGAYTLNLIAVEIHQAAGSPDGPLAGLLNALTFPFLRPVRRVVPPIGGTLDLSPLIVIVIAQLLLMLPVTWLESTLTRAFI